MKRVRAWKDKKVVELTLPEDSRHLWDSQDRWYQRIQAYDNDRVIHVDEIGDEVAGTRRFVNARHY